MHARVRQPSEVGTGLHGVESTDEKLESLRKEIQIYPPIRKSCVKIPNVQGHGMLRRVYGLIEGFRGWMTTQVAFPESASRLW